MRLTKVDSRRRWSEVRGLWCQHDPIGVRPGAGGPDDEYDSYLGPTLRLLESGASLQKIVDYLTSVEVDHMGSTDTPAALLRRKVFAAQLREWYEKRWPNSSV